MPVFSKNKPSRNPKNTGRAPVNSYYRSAGKSEAASPFAKKPKKRNTRKFLFGFLDILIIFILLFGLGHSMLITPDPIVAVDDNSFHNTAVYRSVAAAEIKKFKNRSKLTFSEQAIAADLQKQFPEISTVQIELPLFSQRPKINLKIDKPGFILNSRGINYIVNSSGLAVAKAANLPNVSHFVTVNDQSGFFVNTGSKVLSRDAAGFIDTLIAECRHREVPVTSLTLPPLPQELDLRTADQPYYVKFYLGGDAITQTGQFLATRQHFIDTNQSPGQYLDVRISGKIFYK